VGFNYRFDPVYVAMAQTMSQMGSAFVHARSSFTSSRPAEPTWRQRRATGGPFNGPDFEDGLQALRIVEAAERSSCAGRTISLG